jgi:hypothetical protein
LADPLATLLVQEGAVSLEALAQAQARQRELGGALDTALLELGLLSEERLAEALVRVSGLQPAPPAALLHPDPRSRRLFPARVAERHGLAPFRLEGRELHLAAAWPVDQGALDEISFMLSLALVPHVAPELRVRELRRRIYDAALPERFEHLARQLAARSSPRPPGPGRPGPEAGWARGGGTPPGPFSDPLPEPFPEAVPEPFPEAVPEPFPEAVPDPFPEAVPEPSSEAAPGAVPRAVPEAVPEPLPERFPEPRPEPEPAPEPLSRGAPAPGPSPAPLASGGEGQPTPATEPLAAALAQAVLQAEASLDEEPERAEPPALAPEERSRPPHWDLAAARQALAAAVRRDEAVEAVLRYGRDFFEHVALLAVSRDRLHGHDALGGDPRARDRARGISVPVGPAGIFRAVLDTGGPYLGPPGKDPALEAVIGGLGRDLPRTMLLYPVLVRERVVCVLYADNGEAPVSPRRVGDLLLLTGSLGGELVRILRARKEAGAAAWQALEPARAGLPTAPGEGEAAPGERAEEEEMGPPPFDPLEAVRQLQATGRGSPERGRLVALLVQHGPEAAAALAAALPGTLDARAGAREESLPVDERGPVLAALAALGIVATPYLVATLGDGDARRRRYAAMLLGQIADPAGFLGLANLVFDPQPAVGDAALAALERVRLHPDFRPVLERLRRSLLGDPPRPALAARALARLRDAGAVPALAALLEGAPEAAEAAAAALEALTARDLGRDPAAWTGWWSAHRQQSRADWLFDALEDPDRGVRIAGAEALRALGPSPVSYRADAPEPERRRWAREWRAWFDARGIEA